ncbi:hypothetical protein Hanom_Chr01g00031331 [Helianthus anomalus]
MIASKTFELSVFHPETGTEFFLDFGEVDLDDVEIRAMVGNPTQLTSFEDIFNPQDHSVKIAVDVNDPQVQSKEFYVHDTPASPSVVSNVEKMRNLHGKTIVQGKQAVHRRSKVQKHDFVSSTPEPVIHFTKQTEHRLRLPSDVSSALGLHTDNLKPVKIQNLKGEFQELLTRSEKANTRFRYGFVG